MATAFVDGCEVVISQVATMDNPGFYTPPNARRVVKSNSMDQSFGNLIKLHEMGIITKEELRKKVLQWNPPCALPTISPSPSPFATPPVMTTKTTCTISPSKKRELPQTENIQDNSDVNVAPPEFKKKT